MPAMKTLVVIGYVWPEPDSSAAGSRMLQLLAVFREEGFRIIFASPAEESSHAPDLRDAGIEPVAIRLNCSSFNDSIGGIRPDVVMFDRFMMEEQFGWRVEEACPEALRLLDMEDMHSLRDARHRALRQNRSVVPEDLNSELAYREVAAILRCDLTLVISEVEMQWLTQVLPVPEDILCYSPFMIAPDRRPLVPLSQRQHFVSIGNFRHAPNWDAVLQLKELWPQIRARLPQAECHIYGAYPPPKATQLHHPKSGFLVKGWADSATDVISNARVMLAPLRFGAGLKGKLLEAACLGTPAVTTPIGAEGMYGDAEMPARVCDSDQDFVEAAVALYQDDSHWDALSQRGPVVMESRFSVDIHGQRLKDRLNHLMNGRTGQSTLPFLSGMLRHHYLKSSKYMSQWIEAKNRLRDEEAE